MANETVKSPDTLQRLAENSIAMAESEGLTTYLAEHPRLAELLPKICGEVRRAIGPRIELSLELYTDPEIEDRYLTLYARQDKYEPDILERLQAISERFNPSLEEVPGYFLLTTDFSAPRGNAAALASAEFLLKAFSPPTT